MKLSDIASAVRSLEQKAAKHQSILIYGDPRTGKTRFAATVAKIPEVKRVFFFDTENGSDSLELMARDGSLTSEEAEKIHVIRIVDLPETPIAIDTIIQCLVVQKPVKLCEAHGRRECPACKGRTKEDEWQTFDIKSLTPHDWIIIDTGSQVGISAYNFATKGMNYEEKAGFDEYGMMFRMLSDIFTVIQAAPYCNYIVTAHQLVFDKKDTEKTAASQQVAQGLFSKLYPLIGTRAFSIGAAKYFGTVIYLEKKMNKHSGGSSSTYKSDVITGSRVGMRIEDETMLDFRLVFSKLGLTAWKPPVVEAKK